MERMAFGRPAARPRNPNSAFLDPANKSRDDAMGEIKILGIDPGSRITGYGIIQSDGRRHRYLTSGCIRVNTSGQAERLQQIFAGMQEIIQTFKPHYLAIEQIFIHRNVSSALKLGQARGVAIVAAANHAIPVAEYSARQVKQSVVGYGAAKKEQVQHMVKSLLDLVGVLQTDASDALAVALCHANIANSLIREKK